MRGGLIDGLTVFKKEKLDSLNLQLKEDGAVRGDLVGGFFSPDHVVFLIETSKDVRFLQVHTSKASLAPKAAINTWVENFEVLDLANSKDLFYIYAVKKDSKEAAQAKIEMIQIKYNVEDKSWKQPA